MHTYKTYTYTQAAHITLYRDIESCTAKVQSALKCFDFPPTDQPSQLNSIRLRLGSFLSLPLYWLHPELVHHLFMLWRSCAVSGFPSPSRLPFHGIFISKRAAGLQVTGTRHKLCKALHGLKFITWKSVLHVNCGEGGTERRTCLCGEN